MSMPSISIAPCWGSYSRHNSLASVVLPAPFWPTIASDEPAGMLRSKPRRTGAPRVGELEVTEADLAAGHAGCKLLAARQGASRPHLRRQAHRGRDPCRCAVECPVQPAEGDHRHADRALGIGDHRAQVEA